MRRRSFLKLSAVVFAHAAIPSVLACQTAPPESAAEVFPQGVASGDPTPSSVILWTRVKADGPESVVYEVGTDESMREIVAHGSVFADATSDFTVRIKVQGLSPFRRYYFRFVARGLSSPVGRTKTAPLPDADVPVRFGFATCQDYVGRSFRAWSAIAEEDLDFVLFLGDYIYETDRTPLARVPTADRKVTFANGLPLGADPEDGVAAITLGDYRMLYRTYRTDPDLQKVHQLFPFITIWDDHEFGNDCWQDHTNHFDGSQGEEKRTDVREAASRAWFEYTPIDVERHEGTSFPNDMTIYRSFRFGRHLDLFVTDQRYYRSDHVIPEGPADPSVGKVGTNTILGSRTLVLKDGFDPREAAANPTMLGATQFDWLVNGIKSSQAAWKMIGSQTMLSQMLLDLTKYPEVTDLFRKRYYFKVDQWDGYRSERRRLLDAIAAVRGVVAITGDLHAFYACELRPDFDAPETPATAVEYVVASISAPSLEEQLEVALERAPLLKAFGLETLVHRSDEVLQASNAGFVHARSRAYGVAVCDVDRDNEVRITFIEVSDPTAADGKELGRVAFRTRHGEDRVERVGPP